MEQLEWNVGAGYEPVGLSFKGVLATSPKGQSDTPRTKPRVDGPARSDDVRRVWTRAWVVGGAAAMAAALPAGSSAGVASRQELAERVTTALEETIAPRGNGASLLALSRRDSFRFSFPAPEKGTLLIGWYKPQKGRSTSGGRSGALATAQVQFSEPSTKTVVIKLTPAGRHFLRHALAHKSNAVELEADDTFTTSTGGVDVRETFALRR